ncbi:MAG: FtsX-like permease family protein [Defluviitaleaceae bacterium]|nr:FtsX-like permease family protein [Defluviitaleaceae bacterium]
MILLKKAIRSMWGNKRAYLACIVLISIGLMMYIAMGVTVERLGISVEDYYRDYRMPDGFARVRAIPAGAAATLLRVDGIEDVRLRHVHEARVVMPGADKIITLRLISVPDVRVEPFVSNVALNRGGELTFDNDVWAFAEFIDVHGLDIGDNVTIILGGREHMLNIAGTAHSPEYIYMVRGIGEILPDAETFSVAYMAAASLGNLLGRQGVYNDIAFTLRHGYTFDDVRPLLEDALSRYGLIALYERDEQISASMVRAELDSMAAMSGTIPMVFMFMAIVILYLMLRRVIEQDRTQIGTLKALGYSNAKILAHYLFYGVATGAIGSAVGVVLGYLMAGVYADLLLQFFDLPYLVESPMLAYSATALAIGVIGGAAGAFMGAGSVIKLLPAEAMRPAAPKPIRHDIMRALPFLRYILTSFGFMSVRSIMRSKVRSAFVAVGIMFSFGMLAFMGSFNNMIDVMMLNQYTRIQLYDMRITFETNVPRRQAIEDILRVNYVTHAEGILEIPVELHNRNLRAGTMLTGLQAYSELYRIYDHQLQANIPPSRYGLVLSNMLAESLEAVPGNVLMVSSPFLTHDIELVVTGIANMSMGRSAYLELDALAEVLNMRGQVNGVIFNTDNPAYMREFALYGANITFLEDTRSTLHAYLEFLEPYAMLIYMMQALAVLVAVAIIYNVSTISLSERKREYATLRVLGVQVNEVTEIMALEYWILCIVGIGLGIPFTYLMKVALASSFEMEGFAFPTDTPPEAFAMAAAGCAIAVALSNRTAKKVISKFDMVETLKERD